MYVKAADLVVYVHAVELVREQLQRWGLFIRLNVGCLYRLLRLLVGGWVE
jgi:hypothetical protein